MHFHFISIGGSIMHQLAIALHLQGHKITGSDDEILPPAAPALEQYHLLPPHLGYHAERISPEIDAVIVGMHTHADNVEYKKAQALGLRLYSFPEYIYEATRHKQRVVIAGSHGKTTTTAMLAHILQTHHHSFDLLLGAPLNNIKQSVILNASHKLLIAEGDEYLAAPMQPIPKFLFYKPHIAAITGIAWDHINVFPTFEAYTTQFLCFIESIAPKGILIYNEEDPSLAAIIKEAQKNRSDIHYIPYGPLESFIDEKGQTHLATSPPRPLLFFGKHNLYNAHAALLIAQQLGISKDKVLHALTQFKGIHKRLECIVQNARFQVYSDFAHAPSKVAATIHAIQKQYPQKNIYYFLELHTYSSLQENFMKNYAPILRKLPHLYVYYSHITAQRKKKPILSITALANQLEINPNQIITQRTDLEKIATTLVAPAIILLMSSGSFDQMNWKEAFDLK